MRHIFFLIISFLLVSCTTAKVQPSTPVPIPPALIVAEYPLKQPPEAESNLLYFAVSAQGDPRLLHTDERNKRFYFFDESCIYVNGLGRCAKLGTDTLIAKEDFNNLGFGQVMLTRNGHQVYTISIGHGSPIDGLRGLWVYDDHWALETAYVTERTEGKTIYSDAVGQVSVDGVLLNDEHGYEEAFGFQTINHKPFYFFKRDGKIEANYAGADIPLGFDKILHYGCCSSATLNPLIYQNLVTFFARRGEIYYYVEIGVFEQP